MNFLELTILFPLLGFVVLAISQGKWSENISAAVGVGSIGLSSFVTIYIIFDTYHSFYDDLNFVFIKNMWNWIPMDFVCIPISLRLDGLSLIMLSIIIGIGLIIHVYSAWYMSGSEGYARFFAYTNLFIANMVLLVLSENLLLMYFGWEVVGLCSYLLIGFYHLNKINGIAALKAFIITRFSDICMLCALFMIYHQYHTLNFSELIGLELKYVSHDNFGNLTAWISFMLLIGALGKSAQLPLQNWLISAMVGPTPVSALIHSATMVTAGVYLIIRMSNFFLVTPKILYLIGLIGSLTIVLFGFSALLQSNIKKILAYSTVSQIGYMFLALGGGHWYAAMLHLMTHAFFKALLFLAAGSLIYICRNEQNIFKMGVSYKSVLLIYICFLVGGLSLSGAPIITSGFYSKEMIMLETLFSNNYFFFFSGLLGAILTPIYTFRMIFVIFHGLKKNHLCVCKNKITHSFPLIILLIFSTFISSWITLPISIDAINIRINEYFSYIKIFYGLIFGVLSIFSIWVASVFWKNSIPQKFVGSRKVINSNILCLIKRHIILLCYYGWGFDWLYKFTFVKPYLFIVKKLSDCDPLDMVTKTMVWFLCWLKNILVLISNGKISCYIVSMNIGAITILIVTIFVFL
ncbi:NADH-quinone oxidoreductase subunit L [Candidatus Blochmannia ocreatus (nom. nud.)]|uniref:NADH-quinone oxidoreductase subunit L n=1 Tax=Candidatus Blochmannia ocreatus (nom. nud.) TaxID=251538 RepID=A0ABY4SVE5_9ENTR|nr:NADH-quinone oxidoreductase subunit L [Candidatus Blochmannia ocreatus]URJ24975.1 NADH-quinone oxidoreductase subunit L [Candidatus Blochmannia ocreatus]